LKLLADPNREVWAVEANETMLRHFRAKLRVEMQEKGIDYSDRLTIVKDDILRLGGFPEAAFDAALLINVLYTVADREACLRQVNRILKMGGVLALSTPHHDTSVEKLFSRMAAELLEKGLFERLQQNFESARARHEAMSHLIVRDAKDDIRRYLEATGFTIANDDWQENRYVDAVIVVKAVKTAEAKPAARAVSPESSCIRFPGAILSR
jgi:ubiquinone/menaquinone biosynthesis C-methylase UbiE